MKRQRSYTDLTSIRVRDGDEVGWAIGGSTRATVCFLTSFGKAYTTRIDQLPATTGYGDPVQKYFDFSDREQIVGVAVFDERILPKASTELDGEPELFEANESNVEGPFLVALSTDGQAVRFPISNVNEPSNKNGRTFMRVGKGAIVLRTELAVGNEYVCLATTQGFALVFDVQQIPVFKNAAKGVRTIRLGPKDTVLGFTLSRAARQGLEVETNRGRREVVRRTKFEPTNRGNKGKQVIKRGTLKAVVAPPIEIGLNGKHS